VAVKKPVKKPAKEISSDPEVLRTWVKEDGTELQLNGYDENIKAAVALGWKPA